MLRRVGEAVAMLSHVPPLLLLAAQVLVAMLLGAAIGLERELTAQPAGLRTHMLVSLGAAVFTIAGAHAVAANPAVIAAPVVTGVGFLGGGAILRAGTNVRGLTTAASLWLAAAAGLSVGLREWWLGGLATVLALSVLMLVKKLEHETLPHRRPLEITLTLEPGVDIHNVEHRVRDVLRHTRVLRINYTGTDQQITMIARPRHHHSLAEISERVREVEGVRGVDMSR
jgi:putative Mg2+ transporter-C (MgtC) family protein